MLAALAATIGCASGGPRPAQSTASVAPLREELPNLKVDQTRETSVRAGVLTVKPLPPRKPIVPKFEPIKLTDEEKAALGEPKKDPGADLLAFYKPPPSPERGILPVDNHPDAYYYLPKRLISGVLPAEPFSRVFSETTGRYRVATFGRMGASTYSEPTAGARAFTESSVTIGVAGSRSTARHADSVDY